MKRKVEGFEECSKNLKKLQENISTHCIQLTKNLDDENTKTIENHGNSKLKIQYFHGEVNGILEDFESYIPTGKCYVSIHISPSSFLTKLKNQSGWVLKFEHGRQGL